MNECEPQSWINEASINGVAVTNAAGTKQLSKNTRIFNGWQWHAVYDMRLAMCVSRHIYRLPHIAQMASCFMCGIQFHLVLHTKSTCFIWKFYSKHKQWQKSFYVNYKICYVPQPQHRVSHTHTCCCCTVMSKLSFDRKIVRTFLICVGKNSCFE